MQWKKKRKKEKEEEEDEMGILYKPGTSSSSDDNSDEEKEEIIKDENDKKNKDELNQKKHVDDDNKTTTTTKELNKSAIMEMVPYYNYNYSNNTNSNNQRIAVLKYDGSVFVYQAVFLHAHHTTSSSTKISSSSSKKESNGLEAVSIPSSSLPTTTTPTKKEWRSGLNDSTLNNATTKRNVFHEDRENGTSEEEEEEERRKDVNNTNNSTQNREEGGGGLMMRIDPITTIPSFSSSSKSTPCFTHAAWIQTDLLALLTTPLPPLPPSSSFSFLHQKDTVNKNVVVQIWCLQSNNNYNHHEKEEEGGKGAAIVRELKMTREQLEEYSHASFTTYIHRTTTHDKLQQQQKEEEEKENKNGANYNYNHHHHHPAAVPPQSIEYDAKTDTILLSTFLLLSSSSSSSCQYQPFACVWDWRSSVVGFTTCGDILPSSPSESWWWSGGGGGMSKLYMSHKRNSILIHYHSSLSISSTTTTTTFHEEEEEEKREVSIQKRIKLHKKKYNVGLLSPPQVLFSTTTTEKRGGGGGGLLVRKRQQEQQQQQQQQIRNSCTVEQPCPLLVFKDYIAFPFLSSPSISQDSILEWKESHVPPDYIASCGPVQLAVMGRKLGRSIAVASNRGLCLLDLSRMRGSVGGGGSGGGSAQQYNNKTCKGDKHLLYHDKIKFSPCTKGFVCSPPPPSSSSLLNGNNSPPGGITMNPNPKWRLFGNEREEQSFRVVAMTWWERESILNPGVSADLLVAVVQYVVDEQQQQQQQQQYRSSVVEDQLYLVCWSRRRLGMKRFQLLEEVNYGGQIINEDIKKQLDERKGIPLPKGLIPGSISLLTKPKSALSYHHHHHHKGAVNFANDINSSRALILICSHFNQGGSGGGGEHSDGRVPFAAYQMQVVTKNNENMVNVEERHNQHFVLARLCSSGTISSYISYPDGQSSSGNISGVFIAGGCFNFDFQDPMLVPSLRKHEHIATLGIIKTCRGGLDSVCITPTGPALYGRVILGGHRHTNDEKGSNVPASSTVISKYWVSDIVHRKKTKNSLSAGNSLFHCTGFFVWSIARSDGKVFSWSVPFFNDVEKLISCNFLDEQENCAHHVLNQGMDDFSESTLHPPSLLPTFIPLSTSVNFDPPCRRLLGTACCVGDDSVLMNGASTNDNEVALGLLPYSSAGSILYAGQHSRLLKQNVPNDPSVYNHTVSNGDMPNTLTIETLSVGDCIVSTPSFTTSLFSLFLVAATPAAYYSKRGEFPALSDQLLDGVIASALDDAMVARESAKRLLHRLRHEDAVLMSLRVIILRVIDSISSAVKKLKMSTQSSNVQEQHGQRPSTRNTIDESFLLAKSLLNEVVSISKEAFNKLQFASLFLGIGRQLEPHHFCHLFPLPCPMSLDSGVFSLPNTHVDECSDLTKCSMTDKMHPLRTVEDLFTVCVEHGSLSAASSALPLYSSKFQSHSKCSELLHHCLTKIGHSFSPNIPFVLDTSTEERLFVYQLFCFGLKLEDAEEPDAQYDTVPGDLTNEERENLSADHSGLNNGNLSVLDENSKTDFQVAFPEQDGSGVSTNSEGVGTDNEYSPSDSGLFVSSASSSIKSQDASTESDDYTDESASHESSDTSSEYTSNSSSISDRDGVLPSGVEKKSISHGRVSRLIKIVSPVIWKRNPRKNGLNEEEIDRAASSFILSGFDESEDFEEVSYESDEEQSMDQPNGQANECIDDSTTSTRMLSKLVICKQSFATGSIAGIVAKCLVCMVLSNSVSKHGWQQAAALGQLLLGENHALTSSANSIVQHFLDDDLLSVTMLQRHKKCFQDQSMGNGECSNPDTHAITVYLVDQMIECSNQIDYSRATTVFDLVLVILARYEQCDVVKDLRTYLLLIGVVAGHVAGRVDEIFGQQKETTSIGKCYTIAASKINSVF